MQVHSKAALIPFCLAMAMAGGFAFAQMRGGAYGATNPASLPQPALSELSVDAKYEVGVYPSFVPDLAEGEGRQEVQSFCANCHSTRYITMQPPLPAATWEAEVTKMVKAYGAPVPEVAAKKITSYLQEHYAPENRKERSDTTVF